MTALDSNDVPHPPGPEENWQESVVLVFFDAASSLTGYVRIGTEPNLGSCNFWVYLQAPDRSFYRDMRYDIPATAESRPADGFGAGAVRWRHLGDGRIALTVSLPDAEIALDYTDFYPAMPCWKWLGKGDVDIGATSHYEASGRISGSIRIGDTRFEIADGLGHRDHSWGPRDGSVLRACRWFVGTLGPALSYSAISFLDTNGHLAIGGWVVRDGVQIHARDIDILVHDNIDGTTLRGGKIRMELEDGSLIDIRHDTIANFISAHKTDHGGPASFAGAEGLSRSYSGDMVGNGCLTIVNNVTGVGLPIAAVCEDFATLGTGLGKLRAHGANLIDISVDADA